jgi:hypothetical protein
LLSGEVRLAELNEQRAGVWKHSSIKKKQDSDACNAEPHDTGEMMGEKASVDALR